MKVVQTVNEVFEAVKTVKFEATAFESNLFASKDKLSSWIQNGDLFLREEQGVALFFRKDLDFFHLYFCAKDRAYLREALSPVAKSLTVDLVGSKSNICSLKAVFESAGFRFYRRLCRLSRTPIPILFEVPEERVFPAELEDVHQILQILQGSFDRYAEQLPMSYELESAVGNKQILLVKENATIIGLLMFTTQGFSSTISYWVVEETHRDRGIGAALIRKYFEMHDQVRRFMLWVMESNKNAISKYQHYGFAPDGLVDEVLIRQA
jgi:ribosomal protein S18 acetylase RimI-like enzyme